MKHFFSYLTDHFNALVRGLFDFPCDPVMLAYAGASTAGDFSAKTLFFAGADAQQASGGDGSTGGDTGVDDTVEPDDEVQFSQEQEDRIQSLITKAIARSDGNLEKDLVKSGILKKEQTLTDLRHVFNEKDKRVRHLTKDLEAVKKKSEETEKVTKIPDGYMAPDDWKAREDEIRTELTKGAEEKDKSIASLNGILQEVIVDREIVTIARPKGFIVERLLDYIHGKHTEFPYAIRRHPTEQKRVQIIDTRTGGPAEKLSTGQELTLDQVLDDLKKKAIPGLLQLTAPTGGDGGDTLQTDRQRNRDVVGLGGGTGQKTSGQKIRDGLDELDK